MNRQELLQKFSYYSDEVLEKLHVIAGSILNPNLNQLVSVDFASMVDMVFKSGGLADQYFPSWTDRSKSDFGRFLYELFALLSDKDFWYINHFSKESFGTTAELYRSLVHKAISNGFIPTQLVSAGSTFTLIFPPGAEEVVPRGTIQIGIKGQDAFTFTNEEFTIPSGIGNVTTTAQFYNGIIKSANGNYNGESIVIDDKSVSSGSIKLTIGSDIYTETNSFVDGTASTKHFKVMYDEFGRAEIIFAKGGYGMNPTYQQIYTVEYRKGGGTVGNIVDNMLDTILKDKTSRQMSSFVQPVTSGGSNLLSKEDLRNQTIAFERHLNRVVTLEDAESIVKELDFVYNTKALYVANYLFLFVVPTSGGILSPIETGYVYDHVSSKCSPRDAITVSPPAYIPITMYMDVYLLPNTNKVAATELINYSVREYLDPVLGNDFGQGVNRGVLMNKIIANVPGTQNVDYQTLYRGVGNANPPAPANLMFADSEVVDYANSMVVINVYGGV